MTRRLPCPAAPGPLEGYAARFDDLFGSLAQRRGFREYLAGLLAPRDRNKTLTALAGAEPVTGAQHPAVQRLQFYLSESRWDADQVNSRRLELLPADPATAPHDGGVLVIDDSGDRKDGTKTAHVGHQWLGRYGKTDNGVVTVTTLWADERLYYPVHAVPYTPARHFAKGKSDPAFRTKLQAGADLAVRARDAGFVFRAVAADSAYGDQDGFRGELAEAGLPFVMALKPRHGKSAYGADAHVAFAYVGRCLPSPATAVAPAAGGAGGARHAAAEEAPLAGQRWAWTVALAALQRFIVGRLAMRERSWRSMRPLSWKKRTATVGVARQYAGITGQVENCQLRRSPQTSPPAATRRLTSGPESCPRLVPGQGAAGTGAGAGQGTRFVPAGARRPPRWSIAVACVGAPFRRVVGDEVYGRSGQAPRWWGLREGPQGVRARRVPVNFPPSGSPLRPQGWGCVSLYRRDGAGRGVESRSRGARAARAAGMTPGRGPPPLLPQHWMPAARAASPTAL